MGAFKTDISDEIKQKERTDRYAGNEGEDS